jgi:hypothetical protein
MYVCMYVCVSLVCVHAVEAPVSGRFAPRSLLNCHTVGMFAWLIADYGIVFLGAYAKLRRVSASLVMSVCPSAWNNSAATSRIVMNYDIPGFFQNMIIEFS